jgi:ubiquinol-cytochrome c reductase cytochrome c1 subunit
MFRNIALTAASVLVLSGGVALAEGAEAHVEDVAFAHEGPFGAFDQSQLNRGFQVFSEVCSGCHGLKFVPLRTLADEGGPIVPSVSTADLTAEEIQANREAQVREYAKQFLVIDKETGEEREAIPADNFPANTGAGAPDLSLMAKARAGFHGPYGSGMNQLFRGMGGPEYIVSILTGYAENPECAPDGIDGFYYNTAFANGGYPDSCKIYEETKTVVTKEDGTTVEKVEKKEVGRMAPGSWIAMSPPLSDDAVTYADGHPATMHHMAEDVASFLMWTAEPNLMARKQAGFIGVIMLIVLSTLLFLTNKRIWAAVKGKKRA